MGRELATLLCHCLSGDTLCCFDTELMPKLQHIRVAGKFFLDFEIPHEFVHLWRYMKEMYELDAFGQSCPADQVLIFKIHTASKPTLILSFCFSRTLSRCTSFSRATRA